MGKKRTRPPGTDDPRVARAVEAYERSLDELDGYEGLEGMFADALTSGLRALGVTGRGSPGSSSTRSSPRWISTRRSSGI